MYHYDLIHDVSLSMPTVSGVHEGHFCYIDSLGYMCPTFGNSRIDGYCSYARNGCGTLRIHGVVTAPYEGTAPVCGYVCLGISENGNVVTREDGQNFLVLSVDKSKKTVTFYL